MENQVENEKVTTEETTENSGTPSKSTKEKTRAGEDVIKFAEDTEQGAPSKQSKGVLVGGGEGWVKPNKTVKPPTENKGATVEGFNRSTGRVFAVQKSLLNALSRYIYVNNIYDPTPVIEAVVYKAIGAFPEVTMDITEEQFEELRLDKQFAKRVHYNYVDGFAKNDPEKGGFYHKTYHVNYPEWIKPEDVKKQTDAIVSHYGVPDLSGIEKVLWPNYVGKVKKASLAPEGIVVEETSVDAPVAEEEVTSE